MKTLDKIFEHNKAWVDKTVEKNPNYFKDLASSHKPEMLWIGCSDSRIPIAQATGFAPGNVFVHRNIANLVVHTDFNCLSVIQYAVEKLKVKHIVVCGHYGCGGVLAAMQSPKFGLADNWLRHIRDVYSKHSQELDTISDKTERYNKLAEFNVREQVNHVGHTTIAQEAWANGQPLTIHGWIYDLAAGYLEDLDCSISSAQQTKEIYRVE